MAYLIICLVALLVSGLAFFSGFGLGTLLLPAFALFFPLNVAVAATAVVHLANNIFKTFLLGCHADWKVVARFAIPAAFFAALGAYLLGALVDYPPITTYTLIGREYSITLVKLVIAGLIFFFALLELAGGKKKYSFSARYIPLGGALSGFFGGLSGHQGALRTAFLIRAGLRKEAFLGTMVVSAVIVDVSRLVIYGLTFFSHHWQELKAGDGINLVIVGSLAACAGSFIGSRLLKKVTMRLIHLLVSVLLLLLALALGVGLI